MCLEKTKWLRCLSREVRTCFLTLPKKFYKLIVRSKLWAGPTLSPFPPPNSQNLESFARKLMKEVSQKRKNQLIKPSRILCSKVGSLGTFRRASSP